MSTTSESKEMIASSQVFDKARQDLEGTSTSTPAEPFDASRSSNQSKGDPVFLTEGPCSPPPPRKKSGATLITLPADDVRQYTDPRSLTSQSKTHTRTNTFGTISYEKFECSERQPRTIKEEA